VDSDQASAIRQALERYLSGSDDRNESYRELARQHGLLPVLPGWSGFVGLREDGALFWVSDEDGTVSANLNKRDAHLAKVRGPELFPELSFLTPVPSEAWVECWSCNGTGRVSVEERQSEGLRCQCGGLGKLPPDVAESLRVGER